MFSLRTKLWDVYVLTVIPQRNEVLRCRTLSNAGHRGAWRRWHREKAVLALLPMVERIARDVRWMFAAHLDLQDLTQAGALGLVKAANAFQPALASSAGFESYAYFRVRGAIIDSQKRRAYREESNVSLHAIAERNDGWLPPSLDTDTAPGAYAIAERNEIHRLLASAIAGLPALERTALRGQMAGQPLATTAKQMGRSITWTRAKLAEARTMVGAAVRGE